MNKLSVIIITLNEGKNIARCLDSVKELADEIIVVDSFSTDNTKSICLNYQVNFIEHPFEDYIKQKNWALSQASFDFVLSLDADEALSPRLQSSVKEEKKDFQKDGYTMNRMTSYLGKWIRYGSWYPDRKLRIINRHKGKWEGLNPHDRLELQDGSTTKHLKGDILHFSYYSLEEHIAQFDKFTTLSAIQLHQKGKKSGYKIILSPLAIFFKGFFLKFAFLDGYYGITICFIDAFSSFLKYAKLKELNRKKAGSE
jgi:glycosyltransferase involved in cell wall biosynthesis